jgi:hypothetical protein
LVWTDEKALGEAELFSVYANPIQIIVRLGERTLDPQRGRLTQARVSGHFVVLMRL